MNHTEILKELSASVLFDDEIAESIPGNVKSAGWLGHPPCKETDILAAQARLGVTLPNSLRQFYLITNGWRNLNAFVYAILPIENIGFLADVNPDLADVVDAMPEQAKKLAAMTGVKHDETAHSDYVDEQVTRVVRSIVLSTEGDATTTLIDPQSDIGSGEWDVGAWASWHPGMEWSNNDWWTYLADQIDC